MQHFIVVIFILFLSSICLAEDINFSKDDRVLILAPHPDDETIGTAGIIQKALKNGAKVKVVCFTNGDNNQLAFIVYEKRLTIRKKEFLHMGEVRRKETLSATNFLGLDKNDVIFLGYPDFGTMEILTKYWDRNKPFKSMFARVTKVSYPEAMSFGAPYVGESILNDLKTILLSFKPTKIFVSHPADTNRDHRALYLFLKICLWNLEGKIDKPQIFPYIIHLVGWPKPRGYHPDLELNPPHKITGVSWQKYDLDNEEIEIKNKAISFYKSQIEYDHPYLFTFARKNEFFGDYPIIRLYKQKMQQSEKINWVGLNMAEDDIENESMSIEGKGLVADLAYAYQDNNLWIKITLRRRIDKNFGISIFLLGYNKKIDFVQTPKIHIVVGALGMRIFDKRQRIFPKDIKLSYQEKSLVLKIPLSELGNPCYILSCVKTRDLPLDDIAWRIIELE